ncbi:MAG: hypothetical protein Q9214_008130, partial [Letrouitia sp. 1 TL-2023]
MENPLLLRSTNEAVGWDLSSKIELDSELRYELEDTLRNKNRDVDAGSALSLSSPKACEIDGNELPSRKPRGSLVEELCQSDHITLPGRPDRDVMPELLPMDRAPGGPKVPPSRTSEADTKMSKSDGDKTTNTIAANQASLFEPIIGILPSSRDVELDELKHTIADLEFDPNHTACGSNSVGQAWTWRTPEEL